MLTIAVVEDEALIAKRLQRFIRQAVGEREIKIRWFECFDDAEEFLSERDIDLLFLDLNLSGKDGFELLNKHLCAGYNTIVVSANTDRAMEAFELGVIDFVAKPFTQERISLALDRAQGHNKTQKAALSLSIEKRGRMERIQLDDIAYIRAAGHYSELVLTNGNEALHAKNISALMCLLPKCYAQIHRSYLVDMNRVKELHRYPGSKYELLLDGGELLPVGRSYYKKVRDWLELPQQEL